MNTLWVESSAMCLMHALGYRPHPYYVRLRSEKLPGMPIDGYELKLSEVDRKALEDLLQEEGFQFFWE